jgi:hypothetical protein
MDAIYVDGKICFNSVQNVRTNHLFLEAKGEERGCVASTPDDRF